MSRSLDALRAVLACFLVVSVLFWPWWVSVALMVISAARTRAWEIILAGFAMDCVWLPHGTPPVFTLASICIIWLFEPIRARLL